MASLLTAIGAMAFPLSVLILLSEPKTSLIHWWGIGVGFVGVISIILGWRYVITEEKQRRKETQVFIYILGAIAEKLGVDMPKAISEVEKIMGTRKVK